VNSIRDALVSSVIALPANLLQHQCDRPTRPRCRTRSRQATPQPLNGAMKKHSDAGHTREAESLFKAYEEYAKTLRTWFVAYGIGGPVLLLTNETVRGTVAASGSAQLIGGAFLAAVAAQVGLAFINKTVLWANYFAELRPELASTRRYRFAAWVAEQYWLDVLVDIASMGLFGWATWTAFAIITRVA